MENRHDWTKMTFTLELFRHVLFKLIPDVIMHTQNQDEEQIRDNYDRTSFPSSRVSRVFDSRTRSHAFPTHY